jgi:molybdopterin-guanine dinucleotide biosynthesis protein B
MESLIPIICVVGRSKVGKTTFLEKLIPALKQRGYRVATIKHHAHSGFEIDQRGKDTWRHAQAGSDYVVIAAPDKVASIRRVDREPTLDEIAATISNVDIILTEGYKRSEKPKVEIVRTAHSREPICTPQELLALVSDVAVPFDVPRFDLDDVAGLADLIEARFLRPPSMAGSPELT